MSHPATPAYSIPVVQQASSHESSAIRFLTDLLFAVVLTVAADADLIGGRAALSFGNLIIIAMLLYSFFADRRTSLWCLVLLAATARDIPLENATAQGGLWALRFGLISPRLILLASLIRVALCQRSLHVDKTLRIPIFWLATVPCLTMLAYGNGHTPLGANPVLNDIMLVGQFFFAIVVFRSVRFDRGALLSVLFASFLARQFMDLAHFAAGTGIEFGTTIRVSSDSAKATNVLLGYAGLMCFLTRKSFWPLLLFFGSLILLFGYQTRLDLLFFCIGVLMALLLRFSIFTTVIGVGTLVAALFLAVSVSSKATDVMYARFLLPVIEGRLNLPSDVDDNLLSRVDPFRYACAINVWEDAIQRHYLLWGAGYGGYFTDDVVYLGDENDAAFTYEEYTHGLFFRVHNYFLHEILKYGLVGMGLLTCVWLLPAIQAFRRLRAEEQSEDFSGVSEIILCMLWAVVIFLLPHAMMRLFWSPKGLFLGAALIAICLTLSEEGVRAFTQSKNIKAANVSS